MITYSNILIIQNVIIVYLEIYRVKTLQLVLSLVPTTEELSEFLKKHSPHCNSECYLRNEIYCYVL